MYADYTKIRDSLGYKDADIAKKTGLSRSTFSEWKSGRSPTTNTLHKIAKALDVPVDRLLGETGYYTNSKTADLAQKMYEDKDIRSLFHMKHNMNPELFKAHMKAIRAAYKIEHPEGLNDV